MIDNQSDATLASFGKLTTSSTLSTQSNNDHSSSSLSSLELDTNAIVLGQTDREHLHISNSYWF
jgi:hypothetical protein